MRINVILPVSLAASFFLSALASAQGSLSLAPTRIPGFAAELLFDDGVTQLDVARPKGVDSNIFLIRLYGVPEIGGCEGTDETCLRHYALLVVVGGMPAGATLFDLGTVGEITDIRWLSSPAHRRISDNPPVMAFAAE